MTPRTKQLWLQRFRANLVFAGAALASCAARSGGAQSVGEASPSSAAFLSGVFVSPGEAAAAVDAGALLLDARPAANFLLGHPAGAVHVRWDEFSDPNTRGRLNPDLDALSTALAALGVRNDRTTVVIGGWDTQWGEEGRIYWMLRVLGAGEVAIVEGGFAAWQEAGFDTERGRSQPEAGQFTAALQDDPDATIDELNEFDVILDVRTVEEFDGETPYGAERGGHIPGAAHFEWTRVLNEDGRLLGADALRETLGVDAEARVVTYCTGGVRSAFVWAVLEHAGFEGAANYAGSWWEYAASGAPVE